MYFKQFLPNYYEPQIKPMKNFSKDTIQIRDGDNPNAPLILEKRCGSMVPYPLTSSGNSIYIRFQSTSGAENTRYLIKVKNGKNVLWIR